MDASSVGECFAFLHITYEYESFNEAIWALLCSRFHLFHLKWLEFNLNIAWCIEVVRKPNNSLMCFVFFWRLRRLLGRLLGYAGVFVKWRTGALATILDVLPRLKHSSCSRKYNFSKIMFQDIPCLTIDSDDSIGLCFNVLQPYISQFRLVCCCVVVLVRLMIIHSERYLLVISCCFNCRYITFMGT